MDAQHQHRFVRLDADGQQVTEAPEVDCSIVSANRPIDLLLQVLLAYQFATARNPGTSPPVLAVQLADRFYVLDRACPAHPAVPYATSHRWRYGECPVATNAHSARR